MRNNLKKNVEVGETNLKAINDKKPKMKALQTLQA